ncbi:hypothetical protein [Brevundimonas sp.]|jgi:hypothetical protein|uniref:hypothetical protein n=1 Tax=Brevundimonas sp. TaxID=1871086 RepID=UPI003784BC03
MAVTINGSAGITYPVVAGASSALQASAGKVLQVLQSVKTDTSSFAIGATGDISGLSVSITPTSSTSKVLVTFCVQGSTAHDGILNLYRDATAIGQGDAAGVRRRCIAEFPQTATSGSTATAAVSFLDSPATTSSVTYKIQAVMDGAAGYINRSQTDADFVYDPRLSSSITVMEIAA